MKWEAKPGHMIALPLRKVRTLNPSHQVALPLKESTDDKPKRTTRAAWWVS